MRLFSVKADFKHIPSLVSYLQDSISLVPEERKTFSMRHFCSHFCWERGCDPSAGKSGAPCATTAPGGEELAFLAVLFVTKFFHFVSKVSHFIFPVKCVARFSPPSQFCP